MVREFEVMSNISVSNLICILVLHLYLLYQMTSVYNLSDFIQSCRVCLTGNITLTSLEANIVNRVTDNLDNKLTIRNVIEMFSTIPVATEDELFPTSICCSCKILVESAYSFKLKYEQSSEILQLCLVETKSTKAEILDSEDDENKLETVELESEDDRDQETNSDEQEKAVNTKDEEFLVPCPICTIELPALELRAHAHTHKALRRYLDVPKVSAKTRFYATPRRTASIFDNTEIKHKCPSCDLDFFAADFRIHVEKHRKQDEYNCDKCERSFRKISYLNIHRKKHLEEFPYKCLECDKGFMIERNYECHLLTHSNVQLPHVCSFCSKSFSNPEHLHRHQMIHTENVSYSKKYKVFRCGKCLKSFKEKELINNHMCNPVKKMDEYPCSICNRTYTNSSSLYTHIRYKHSHKHQPFTKAKGLCSVCGNHVTNLSVHMLTHTGEKPFECPECLKAFSSNAVLQRHRLVHSGLKPFVCTVCGKAFNNLYNLQVHERIHIGIRRHVCNICGKGFLEKSYLRKHSKIHSYQ